MQRTRVALYTGSFDPPTNGHMDILEKALGLFDEVVVAIGVHPGKSPLFEPQERAELIRECIGELQPAMAGAVRVSFFSDLATAEAHRHGATVIVRGLRDATDFDYEMQMGGMNAALAPAVTTVFLPASPIVRPITATLVRQIARMGGDVSAFVPAVVAHALKQKLARP